MKPRSAKASAIGINSPRLRAMSYSPMRLRQTHVLDHLSTAIFFHTF